MPETHQFIFALTHQNETRASHDAALSILQNLPLPQSPEFALYLHDEANVQISMRTPSAHFETLRDITPHQQHVTLLSHLSNTLSQSYFIHPYLSLYNSITPLLISPAVSTPSFVSLAAFTAYHSIFPTCSPFFESASHISHASKPTTLFAKQHVIKQHRMISQLLATEKRMQQERSRATGASLGGNSTMSMHSPASKLLTEQEGVSSLVTCSIMQQTSTTGAATFATTQNPLNTGADAARNPDAHGTFAGTNSMCASQQQTHSHPADPFPKPRAPISINTQRNTQQDWDAALQSHALQRHDDSPVLHPSYSTPNTAPVPIPRGRRKSLRGDESASSSLASAHSLPDRFSYEKLSLSSPCSPIHVRRGFPSLASLRVPTPDEQKREVIKAQKIARLKARREKQKSVS